MKKIISVALSAFLLLISSPARGAEDSERAAAENRFISGLEAWPGTADDEPKIDLSTAENYRDSLLAVPGKFYQVRGISATTYFRPDSAGTVIPLMDTGFPAESIANLFLLPVPLARTTGMDLSVMTHEYGSATRLQTTVDKLLSYCEGAGCQAFFGVEKLEEDNLSCSLFLYNPAEGYDHVFKLDCHPSEILAGNGVFTGRVSLFVPTDNVSDLFRKAPEGKTDAGRELERQMNVNPSQTSGDEKTDN